MLYEIRFKPRAIRDLAALSLQARTRIVGKIEGMRQDLRGDVRKLTGLTSEYRLRVGDDRVLFEIEGNEIVVSRIRHRREAYR